MKEQVGIRIDLENKQEIKAAEQCVETRSKMGGMVKGFIQSLLSRFGGALEVEFPKVMYLSKDKKTLFIEVPKEIPMERAIEIAFSLRQEFLMRIHDMGRKN